MLKHRKIRRFHNKGSWPSSPAEFDMQTPLRASKHCTMHAGGSAAGGSAVGGSAAGGSATGGSATGGSAMGGSAVGGSAAGESASGRSAIGWSAAVAAAVCCGLLGGGGGRKEGGEVQGYSTKTSTHHWKLVGNKNAFWKGGKDFDINMYQNGQQSAKTSELEDQYAIVLLSALVSEATRD